jgi:hypothetical protein
MIAAAAHAEIAPRAWRAPAPPYFYWIVLSVLVLLSSLLIAVRPHAKEVQLVHSISIATVVLVVVVAWGCAGGGGQAGSTPTAPQPQVVQISVTGTSGTDAKTARLSLTLE